MRGDGLRVPRVSLCWEEVSGGRPGGCPLQGTEGSLGLVLLAGTQDRHPVGRCCGLGVSCAAWAARGAEGLSGGCWDPRAPTQAHPPPYWAG